MEIPVVVYLRMYLLPFQLYLYSVYHITTTTTTTTTIIIITTTVKKKKGLFVYTKKNYKQENMTWLKFTRVSVSVNMSLLMRILTKHT